MVLADTPFLDVRWTDWLAFSTSVFPLASTAPGTVCPDGVFDELALVPWDLGMSKSS